MRILATGATGFVGRPLVRRLVERGHEVTVLTRDEERAAACLPARCGFARWDPGSAPLSSETLRGYDAILHLAGEGVADQRWSEERKRRILASRVESTKALTSAMAQLPPEARPRAFVSASAIGLYGDRGDERLNEDSTPGSGFLADVCRAWESSSLEAESLGARTVVVRIGVVLGRDGGALAKMLPPFQMGGGGRLGDGKQWMSWIHLDDLVELFLWALESPDIRGVLNGVAPNPVTNADFTTALGRALHRPTLFPIPRFALGLIFGEMSAILVDSQKVYPDGPVSRGFKFRFGEIQEALASLADGSHEIHAEQWVDRPISEVFSFYSDARNLEALTPPFLRFQVLGTSTATMEDGTLIDYRLSLHGIPMKWRSRIESWVAGKQFVDTQVTGPYAYWHHTHRFEPYRGGTIVRDDVVFRLPMGGFGDALGMPLVRGDLEKIFAYRRQRVREIFGSASSGRQDEASNS